MFSVMNKPSLCMAKTWILSLHHLACHVCLVPILVPVATLSRRSIRTSSLQTRQLVAVPVYPACTITPRWMPRRNTTRLTTGTMVIPGLDPTTDSTDMHIPLRGKSRARGTKLGTHTVTSSNTHMDTPTCNKEYVKWSTLQVVSMSPGAPPRLAIECQPCNSERIVTAMRCITTQRRLRLVEWPKRQFPR